MRLGAKCPAKCPKVDEEAWPSDEASEAEGEGRTAGRGEKKKEKKTKKKKKKSRATIKVSQKSTGVWKVPSLRVSVNGIVLQYWYETASGVV